MVTSNSPQTAACQIQLFITWLSHHWLSLSPPPPIINQHHCHHQQQWQAPIVHTPGELPRPFASLLRIGMGNPGVFQGYPHPYPRKPVPMPKGTGTGTGFAKTWGYATCLRVCPQKMTNNLASAVQMSMDTVLQPCEDSKVVSNDSGGQTGLIDGACWCGGRRLDDGVVSGARWHGGRRWSC